MAANILIPLPTYGFDPTEAAIPWKLLVSAGNKVSFATPDGKRAKCDERMLLGTNLGIWKNVLRARKDAVIGYREMERSDPFLHPLKYDPLREQDFDALLLPGGHDKGVREYLESKLLQDIVADFFTAQKPVAAICHGVVLAARSIDPITLKSVLHSYKTTALLRSQEMGAYQLTRFWLNDYYLTYRNMTVQDEVTSLLADKSNFITGPTPLFRDDLQHLKRGFVVRDRKYLSARWPGDAYNFALEFIQML